jgi:hypothetical protein
MLCGDILIDILVIGDVCGFVVTGGVITVISIVFKFSYC